MENSTKTIKIPRLGQVTGTHDIAGGVTQYLGVPYGSVSKRWTRAKPLTAFPDGKHDGTKHGSSCPQMLNPDQPNIQQLAVPGYPSNPVLEMDEFNCLNMNIVVPTVESSEPLPVMVWIHGGGFALGSNNETLYIGTDLVKASVEAKTPIIYVAIHYRLGVFGFLASTKMKSENNGQAVGNYGLWDQRLALEFVKKNIAAFGGDENMITIFGESAGSASVQSHCLADKNLFNQAICQSGVARTMSPFVAEDSYMNERYGALAQHLGHDRHVDPDTLRQVSAESMLAATVKLSGGTLAAYFITDDSACEDGFFPSSTDWLTPQSSCERFMIGDCTHEGMIIGPSMARLDSTDAVALLSGSSAPSQEYLSKFSLDLPNLQPFDIHDKATFHHLIDLMTEITFAGPTEAVIRASKPATTYVFRFDRPNLWSGGPFKGLAHHTIDMLYMFGAPKAHPTTEPEKDIQLSETMMNQWIAFAVGKEPWKPYGNEEWQMVYTPDGEAKLTKGQDVTSRDFKNVHAITGENAARVSRLAASLSAAIMPKTEAVS